MQFEILNTLNWIGYWLFLLFVYVVIRNKLEIKEVLKFKYFFLALLLMTASTHQQFYTLTEKVDVERSTQRFTFNANNNTLDEYLEDNKDIVKKRTNVDRDLELLYQQQKSEALAKQIEDQSKEK